MSDQGEEPNDLTSMPATLGTPDEPEPEGDGEPSVEDQVAELQRKIEAGEERQQAMENFYTSTISQLAGAQSGQQAPQVPEQPSFNDLPDPVEKPEEFRTALSERLNQTIQQNNQQLTTQQQRAQQLDGLMNKFSQQYPDLASREALLSGATQQEANALRQRGVQDVQSAVLADQDGFLKRVANRMQKELGTTEPAAGGEPNNAGGGNQQPASGRTQGVSGGSKTSGKGTPKEKVSNFSDQLKKTQLDSGLI